MGLGFGGCCCGGVCPGCCCDCTRLKITVTNIMYSTGGEAPPYTLVDAGPYVIYADRDSSSDGSCSWLGNEDDGDGSVTTGSFGITVDGTPYTTSLTINSFYRICTLNSPGDDPCNITIVNGSTLAAATGGTVTGSSFDAHGHWPDYWEDIYPCTGDPGCPEDITENVVSCDPLEIYTVQSDAYAFYGGFGAAHETGFKWDVKIECAS